MSTPTHAASAPQPPGHDGSRAPAVAVLIPFYNEAGNITPLIREVEEAYAGLPIELICVNDASEDATAEELARAKSAWRSGRFEILTHVERCGKSAALYTGFQRLTAPWVQLLDGDGQNAPADGRRVFDSLIGETPPSDLGLIAGRRSSRNDGGFKWLQSRIANGMRRFTLNDGVTDSGCGFKLIRTAAARDIPFFAAFHRFIPALVKRAGWRVEETPVEDRARTVGVSKYGFLDRLGAGFVDLLGVMWLMRRGGYGRTGPQDNA